MWFAFMLLAMTVIGPISVIFVGILNDKSFLSQIQFGGFLCLGVILAISFVCGIGYLVHENKKRIRRKRQEFIWNDEGDRLPNPEYVPYTPKPNIIVEFIKAKYNKYCPKIEWTKK